MSSRLRWCRRLLHMFPSLFPMYRLLVTSFLKISYPCFCKVLIHIHAIIVTVAIQDCDTVAKNFRRKDEKREELWRELYFLPSCGAGTCRIPMVHFPA